MQMRARINTPTTWTDVLNVKYSDVRTIVNGSITKSTVVPASHTRGDDYAWDDFTLVADTLTISLTYIEPMFIDEADRSQQSYVDQMNIASYQGKSLNEKIESLMLAEHASWTADFGVNDLAGTGTENDTTAITVSSSNIDDLIRAIKRKLYKHEGVDLAVEKGVFIVWRPEDFELLEAFVQANGFTEADIALKNGIPVQKAFRYMGVDHYLSTSHASGHLFAGIKGCGEIGVLRSTFGKAKFLEDPASGLTATFGPMSGLGITTRVDYGFNWPAYNIEFFMDVNVA
jgi:hypothetical protein